MRLSPLRLFAVLFSLSVLSFGADSAQAQATIHVPADQPTIQGGINAANNGDTVLVAPGTYYENIDFKGKAINVSSSAGAASTIIDGSKGNIPAVTFKTNETRDAILRGFTVQFGGIELYYGAMGGIYVDGAAPTIANNVITQNHCYGIWSLNSSPLIQNNEIDNTLDASGGCSFAGGAAIWLDGSQQGYPGNNTPPPPVVIGNILQNNVHSGQEDAGGNGGAGIADWTFNATIELNTVRNNKSHGVGAGIHLEYGGGIVIGNLVYGNESGGGGAFDVSGDVGAIKTFVANNTFAYNTFGGGGSESDDEAVSQVFFGPFVNDGSAIAFVNNIVAGNTAEPAVACGSIDYPATSKATLILDHNLFFNAGGPAFYLCPDPTGTYGNLTADPQFANVGSFDFHLQPSSPAVDAGNNSVNAFLSTNTISAITSVSQDLDGKPRPQDATGRGYPVLDMGAYELSGVLDANPTTLLLTPSTYSGSAGVPFTLHCKAFSPNGIPTGPVSFFEDGVSLGTEVLDATGTAIQSAGLTPGIHHFVATYPGQGVFTAAVSIEVIVVIDKYGPTLTFTSSSNPSQLNSPVTFTVTITSPDNTILSPVTLTDTTTNTVLATLVPNSAGMASYNTSSLPLGYSYITASYAGDATHNGTSASVNQDVVNGYATSVSLGCAPSPIAVNVTSLCTINVSSANGTPTGSVTLTDNGTTLATLPLTGGGATYTYTGSSDGSHILTAAYPVTGTFNASAATFSLTVNGLPTNTTLTINPASTTAGNPVTLAAAVMPVTPIANPMPTGSVSFYYTLGSSHSTVALGSFKLTGNGTVSLTVPSLPAGSLHFTCTYSGDATFASSSCTPGSITVNAPPVAPTSLTLGSSANPSADLAPVTFTAQLTGNGAPLANAAISLVLNMQSIQLVTDANGSASYTTSTLPVGATTVTANYAGTTADAAAAASLVQQVLAPTFDFSLTAATPGITLQTGHHGTLPLTLTSIGGFHGSVTIGCTGQLPPYVTCELPSSMALAAASSAPVPFTLDTDAVLNFYASERAPASGTPPIAFALLLPFAVLGFARRRSSRSNLARHLLAVLPVCLLAIGLSGCNGYYPGSTPAGTYVISVTATGTSQGSAVINTHTLQVTLIVTP